MKLSIVTTMYNSETYLEEFYSRCIAEAEKLTKDIEIIFVNDGSPDKSLDKAIELHYTDKRVKVIDLSRNFGHHKAIITGLSYSSGDYVFLIDCDLEEDPELLENFYRELLHNPSADVIFGVQESRRGKFKDKFFGDAFYKVLNLFSGKDMPLNPLTVRIMTRRFVNSLLTFPEKELYLAGLFYLTGFNQIPLKVSKKSKGISTYTLRRKLALAVNAVTSFSDKPLLIMFNTGLVITSFSFLYILYLVFTKVFFNNIIAGWTSMMASFWLIGGLIILFMGVLGIYISKIYLETKGRPIVIIKNIYEGDDENELS